MIQRQFLLRQTTAVLVVCATFIASSIGVMAEDATVIDAPTALEKLSAGEVVMIDIRRPKEWRDTGVAVGAKPITMHDPKGPQSFVTNILAAVGGDRATPIALICASGVRSTYMQKFLRTSGFTTVLNVKEGMLGRGRSKGWIARGLPVEAYTADN